MGGVRGAIAAGCQLVGCGLHVSCVNMILHQTAASFVQQKGDAVREEAEGRSRPVAVCILLYPGGIQIKVLGGGGKRKRLLVTQGPYPET